MVKEVFGYKIHEDESKEINSEYTYTFKEGIYSAPECVKKIIEKNKYAEIDRIEYIDGELRIYSKDELNIFQWEDRSTIKEKYTRREIDPIDYINLLADSETVYDLDIIDADTIIEYYPPILHSLDETLDECHYTNGRYFNSPTESITPVAYDKNLKQITIKLEREGQDTKTYIVKKREQDIIIAGTDESSNYDLYSDEDFSDLSYYLYRNSDQFEKYFEVMEHYKDFDFERIESVNSAFSLLFNFSVLRPYIDLEYKKQNILGVYKLLKNNGYLSNSTKFFNEEFTDRLHRKIFFKIDDFPLEDQEYFYKKRIENFAGISLENTQDEEIIKIAEKKYYSNQEFSLSEYNIEEPEEIESPKIKNKRLGFLKKI